MRRIVLVYVLCVTASSAISQNLRSVFFYAGPTYTRTTINRIGSDFGVRKPLDQKYPWKLRYNFGAELGIDFKHHWSALVDFNFQAKGNSQNVLVSIGNGNEVIDDLDENRMVLVMGTLALAKQFLLQKPDQKLVVSAGAFYGIQFIDYLGSVLADRETYDDRGVSFGLAWQKKHFCFKIVYERGLVDVFRADDYYFRTSAVLFRFGYVFF